MRFLLMFLMMALLVACSSSEENGVTITQDNVKTTICSVVDNDSRSYVKYTKSNWDITDTKISVQHYQPSTVRYEYSVQTMDTLNSNDNEAELEYRVHNSANQDVYINVINQRDGSSWTTKSIKIRNTGDRKQTYFTATNEAQKAINQRKPISQLRHPQQ